MKFLLLISSKTVINLHVAVFCVVTPCSHVVRYRRFGGPWCVHHQGEVNGWS